MAKGSQQLRGAAIVDTLGDANFREFAPKVIQKYLDRDMIADAMIWAQIVKCYEAKLAQDREQAWREGALRARGADMDSLGLESLLEGNPYKRIG